MLTSLSVVWCPLIPIDNDIHTGAHTVHDCLSIRRKWVNEKCLVHLFHRIKPGGSSVSNAVHIIELIVIVSLCV